jgi:hypothetical protein
MNLEQKKMKVAQASAIALLFGLFLSAGVAWYFTYILIHQDGLSRWQALVMFFVGPVVCLILVSLIFRLMIWITIRDE